MKFSDQFYPDVIAIGELGGEKTYYDVAYKSFIMEDDKKILVNLLTTKEELKSLITECLSTIKIEPPEREREEELLEYVFFRYLKQRFMLGKIRASCLILM